MASHLSELFYLLKSHPFIASSLLLFLFTPPIFPVVVFFSPLIISTALCVLAVLSFGPHFGGTASAAAGTEPEHMHAAAGRVYRTETVASIAEEKLEDVDMACNSEVTWLEWLQNEHSKELLSTEPMSSTWEAEGASAIGLTEEQNVPSDPAKTLPSSTEEAAGPEDGEREGSRPIGEQDEEEREAKQMDAQDQKLREIVEEEHEGSLRFSFSQDSNLGAAPAEQEADHAHEGTPSADAGDDKAGSHGGSLPTDVANEGTPSADAGDDKAGSHGGIPTDVADEGTPASADADAGDDKAGSHGGTLPTDVADQGTPASADADAGDDKGGSHEGTLPTDVGDDELGSHET